MNTFKKLAYAGAASAMIAEQTMFGAGSTNGKQLFGASKADPLNTGSDDAAGSITSIIIKLLSFVTLIAVAYALYGGFLVMTAGGDDGKAKKGRTIIIQVLIGIVIMWLAYAIVNLVVGALASN